jgi:hypothetical protein
VAFNPFSSISVGVSDTTQTNAVINAVNTLLTGLGQSGTAVAASPLTVGTTAADVAGCSISLVVAGTNAFVEVTMVFDVQTTVTTSNNVFLGTLLIDGVGGFPEAHADDRESRITVSQTVRAGLAAGSHTLKLQAAKTPGGSFTAMASHTTLTVTLFDVV